MHSSVLMTTALIVSLAAAQADPAPPFACHAVRPTPSKPTICNKKGSLNKGNPIGGGYYSHTASDAQTVSACATNCNDLFACQSFSFDSTAADGSKCQFYGKSIKRQGFIAKPASTVAFYDLNCYACDPCVVNIANRGFDTGAVDPWVPFNTRDPSGIVTPGANSKYAYELTSPNEDFSNQATIDQSFNWCGGTTYNVSFKKKGDGAGDLILSSETDSFFDYTSDAGPFTTFTVAYTPTTNTGYISITSLFGSSIILDSISITPA